MKEEDEEVEEGGGGEKVFSNQSHCRPVVTCSQTDKVAFPDRSHPSLSYRTPPSQKKKKNTAAGGDRSTAALSR